MTNACGGTRRLRACAVVTMMAGCVASDPVGSQQPELEEAAIPPTSKGWRISVPDSAWSDALLYQSDLELQDPAIAPTLEQRRTQALDRLEENFRFIARQLAEVACSDGALDWDEADLEAVPVVRPVLEGSRLWFRAEAKRWYVCDVAIGAEPWPLGLRETLIDQIFGGPGHAPTRPYVGHRIQRRMLVPRAPLDMETPADIDRETRFAYLRAVAEEASAFHERCAGVGFETFPMIPTLAPPQLRRGVILRGDGQEEPVWFADGVMVERCYGRPTDPTGAPYVFRYAYPDYGMYRLD